MRVEKQKDGWWIVAVPEYHVDAEPFTSCGPYRTKAEAEDDRRGLQRFFAQNPSTASEPVQRSLF